MSKIADNVIRIREAVAKAASDAGREPSEISIMAATKYTDRSGVEELIKAGINLIGENRVLDAEDKLLKSDDSSQPDIHTSFPECRVHLIGQLQTNKINHALKLFDLIETVDRISLADALDKRLDRPLPILVEVKLTGEETKTGCPISELPSLLDYIWKSCPHLDVRGFMGMGPWDPDPEAARPYYRELKGLFDKFRPSSPNPGGFRTISMGMSADFQVAIQEGASIVRIGRAFFE
jgi:PLP dependent protein